MLEQNVRTQRLPRGLDAFWDSAVGLAKKQLPRTTIFLHRAKKVQALADEFSGLTDSNLREQAQKYKEMFRRRQDSPRDLERAFALVIEVAERKIGERPFLVQIAGAFALETGCVAEMATGEGKTLTATLPATVAGWRGRGCHIITVNDYLAKRDAQWMGRIYRFCRLSVSYIQQQTPPEKRRQAYLADITYCTNKEVTADFLRDRLKLGRLRGVSSAILAGITTGRNDLSQGLVQRGLHCAIVDEADSILVDEAVTPLIISGDAPNPEQVKAFSQAAQIGRQLKAGQDYKTDSRYREIELTGAGRKKLDHLAGDLSGVWTGRRRREELITQALTAKELFLAGKDYIVDDDRIVIVDEFTGRLMPDRSWRDGLHQAIEAKEGMDVNPVKATYARISFQRFFRMYNKLSGMTGTAVEARPEFWQIYHLPVAVIPTNRRCVRKTFAPVVFSNEAAKKAAILEEIQKIHHVGRPVLVGTRSVKDSEQLSSLLNEEGLDHQVLNAVRHEKEASIVAQAGQRGKITVATNMAGRGTDIKLGRGVADLGGLHVIAAEMNESARIDRQLFGRCARQGDPGSAQAIVSLNDEITSRYVPGLAASFKRRYGNTTKDISSSLTRGIFRFAQRRAEKMMLRKRKSVLRTDHWLDEQLGFAGRE